MAGKHSFQPLETFLYPVLSPLECASQVHGVFINIDLLFTFGGQPKAVTYILGISWATLIQLQRELLMPAVRSLALEGNKNYYCKNW